jgi:opacity protein-like surface antigen
MSFSAGAGKIFSPAGSRIKTALLISAALACLPGPVSAEPALKTEAQSISLSLDGDFERYGTTHGESLRAGVEFECASELKLGRSALDWNLQLYYAYSHSVTDGAATNARSEGVDFAKILLSGWRGREFKAVKPYLLAGVELTWLKEPDSEEEGGYVSSRFISPTLGYGVELKINHSVTLNAEYRRNLTGRSRRVSGMTLGLSYAILGGDDEDGEPEKEKEE